MVSALSTSSDEWDALQGLSNADRARDESGRGRLSLGDGAGDSGHLKTRFGPRAEVVTRRRARSVSAMDKVI